LFQEPVGTILGRTGTTLKNTGKRLLNTEAGVLNWMGEKTGAWTPRETLPLEQVPSTGSFWKNMVADTIAGLPEMATVVATAPVGAAAAAPLVARELIGPVMARVLASSVQFGVANAINTAALGGGPMDVLKSAGEGAVVGPAFSALPVGKLAARDAAQKITQDTVDGMAGLWRHPTFSAAVARVAKIDPAKTHWLTDVAATALALTAAEKTMHPEETNQEIAASVLPMTVFKGYERAMQGWKARGEPVPTPAERDALLKTVTDSILRPQEPVALPLEGLGELPSGTGQERAIAARFSPTIAEARRIAPELAGVEERLTAANARLKEAQDQAADFASTSDNMEGLQPILEARDRAAAEVKTLENEHAGRAIEALERRIAIGEEHIAGLQERIGREQDETSRDVLEDDFARATDRIEALKGHLGEVRDAQARGDYGAAVLEKQAGDRRLEAGGTEGQQGQQGQQGREGTMKGAGGAKTGMPPEGEKGVKGAGGAKPPRPGVPGEQEAVAKELMEVQGRLAKEFPETNSETMWDLPRAARTDYEGLVAREAELKARMREILAAQRTLPAEETARTTEGTEETMAPPEGGATNVAAEKPPRPLTPGQERVAAAFAKTLPEETPTPAPDAVTLPPAGERLAGLRESVKQAEDKVRRRGFQLQRKNLKAERRVFYREEYAAAERELEAARKELGEAETQAGGLRLEAGGTARTTKDTEVTEKTATTKGVEGPETRASGGERIAASRESAKGLERAVRDLVVQSGARVRVRISEEAPYLTTEEALRYPEGSDVRTAGETARAAGEGATATRKFASINLETGEVTLFKGGTLLDAVHEIAHWFREKPGVFTLRERAAIEKEFPGDWNGERFARAAEEWWGKQAKKEGTTEYTEHTEGAKGPKSLIERAYRKFVEFLKNVGDALGLRDLTVGDVYGRVFRGEKAGDLRLEAGGTGKRKGTTEERFQIDEETLSVRKSKMGLKREKTPAEMQEAIPKGSVGVVASYNDVHNPHAPGSGYIYLNRDGSLLVDGIRAVPGDVLWLQEDGTFLDHQSSAMRARAKELVKDRLETVVQESASINRKIARLDFSQETIKGPDDWFNPAPKTQWERERYPKARVDNYGDLREYEWIDSVSPVHDPKALEEAVIQKELEAKRFVVGGLLHIFSDAPLTADMASALLLYQDRGGRLGKTAGEALIKAGYFKPEETPKGGKIETIPEAKRTLNEGEKGPEAAQEAKRTLNEIERFQTRPRETEKRKGKTGWIPRDSVLNTPEYAEVKKRMGGSFEVEKGPWMQQAHTQMRRFLRFFTSPTPYVSASKKELRGMAAEKQGFVNRIGDGIRNLKEHRSLAQRDAMKWWKGVYGGLSREQMGAMSEGAIARNLQYDMGEAEKRGVTVVQAQADRAETRLRNMEEALRTADPGDAKRRSFLEGKIREGKGLVAEAGQSLDRARERGESLPWGFSSEQARTWIGDVEGRLAKDAVLGKKLDERAAFFQDLAQQQVDLGILTKSQAQNPYYYHEIMIEYADAYEVLKSTGERLKTPEGRSYQRHRSLNDKDYLTNVLKVDHLVVGQMLNDILDAKLIRDIRNDPYVVKMNDDLKVEMARITEERLKRDPKARPATLLDVLQDKPELKNWAVNPGVRWFARKAFREEVMSEITQRLASMPSDVFQLSRADLELKKQAAFYDSFVMPKDVVDQLNDVHNEGFLGTRGMVGKVVAPVMQLWKRAMLNLPWRSLRYGINNLIGDMEGVIAGCPKVAQGADAWKRVFRDLLAYYRKGEASPELDRAVRAGVLSGGLTQAELKRGFEDLPAYKRFLDLAREQEGKKLGMADAGRLARRLWRLTMSGETMNEFRESLLRYKSFLYAEEQLAAGKKFGSAELPWAASLREQFVGLSPEKQAAKWSRELLIDYGAISAGGQMLRQYLVPFYSWFEGNPKRYKRLVENSVRELKDHWGEDAWKAAKPATRLAASFLLMTGGVAMWNNLMFGGDEEAKKGMPEYAKERGYLLVAPAGEKHDVYYLRVASASRDLLEWAGGIEGNYNTWKQFASGQIGLGDAIGYVPKEAVNKLAGGLGPISSGIQVAFGQQLFPNVFEPRPMRNRDVALADLFGLGGIYEWGKDFFTPVPARRGIDPWLSMLALKHNDSGLGAYQEVRDLRYQFGEQVLNQTWEGGGGTPKSKLAYLLRLARRYKDEKAEDRIVERLGELGVRPGQVRDLLKGGDPLRGLSRANRRAFEDWLTPEQRDKLEMAETYYQETFR